VYPRLGPCIVRGPDPNYCNAGRGKTTGSYQCSSTYRPAPC
jgi:hypothetical protein